MIQLNDIKKALNPNYICDDSIMSERKEGMRVSVKHNKEFVLFESDHKKAKYNDCFNQNEEVVNRKADYIIFSIKNNTIYAVIAELKVSDDPREQLDLTEYLVNYIVGRILYKHKSNMNVIIKKVGVFKKLPQHYKSLTKPGKIYNDDGYAFTDTTEFRLGLFLLK